MNPKTLLTGLTGLIFLCTADAAFAATTFLPGLYEIKVSHPGDDSGIETTRECLTPAEARQESLEQLLMQAVRDRNCTFTQRNIGAGQFAIVGNRNHDGIRSSLKQSGTYSPTAMAMNMTMTMMPVPGTEPVRMDMVLSSRRVAASCPPGSDND